MVKTWTADGTILETIWESRRLPDYKKLTLICGNLWFSLFSGGLAQLGEHLPCKQRVESSNLLVSIVNKDIASAGM